MYELSQALQSPGSTEVTRKAHSDAQKMVELFATEMKRRDAEIDALDEEDEGLDVALQVLKNL